MLNAENKNLVKKIEGIHFRQSPFIPGAMANITPMEPDQWSSTNGARPMELDQWSSTTGAGVVIRHTIGARLGMEPLDGGVRHT